ncbi:hypothetical protein KAT80_03950 [Candidatus Pacearchaeota archaeon]|nr:hypothetical protein [Candidatus Pacearchaeota archaeon]
MIKKVGVKKKSVFKKIPVVIPKIKKQIVHSKKLQTEKILIENFIALQKVITNLSIKFDGLTNQISSLLELFEVSAKTLAEKDFDIKKENRDNKQIIEKIDNLLEQNRTIARGVALIHEGNSGHKPIYPPQRIIQKPIPESTQNIDKYQKSISPKSPQTTEFKQLKRD